MTLPVRLLSPLAPAAPLARFVKALKFGEGFATANFRDTPQISTALTALAHKAAVDALVIEDAPDLVNTGVVDAAALQLLSAFDVFESCRSRMRAVPFDLKVPREIGTGSSGSWADEGHPLPIVSNAFDVIALPPRRIGSLTVLSDELLRSRRAEALIGRLLLANYGRTSTAAFLDPSAAVPSGVTVPPPITTGAAAVEVTTSGALATDLDALLAAVETSGAGLALIARPAILARVAAAIGLPLASLGLATIPAPSAPAGLLVLADLAEILCAEAPLAIELSDNATVEMSDAPTENAAGSPAGGTSLVSTFQSNLNCYRVVRFVNWYPREGSVAFVRLNTGSPA